jgi:hypothetical protein
MKLYEKINAENWGRGLNKVCLLEHLRLAYRKYPGDVSWMYSPELAALENAILALYPERMHADIQWVPHFNDHPATTVDDVLRVCKTADV